MPEGTIHIQFAIRAYRIGLIGPKIFTHADGSACTKEELDVHVENLVSKGYTIFPCPCEKHGPKGECLGFDTEN